MWSKSNSYHWSDSISRKYALTQVDLEYMPIKSTLVHDLAIWQYWFWFWFMTLWTIFFQILVYTASRKTFNYNITINTSLRSHGKWGDFLFSLIPIFWCLSILTHSNGLLRLIEVVNQTPLFTIRICGRQWSWVYFYSNNFADLCSTAHKNIGRERRQWYATHVEKPQNVTYNNYLKKAMMGSCLEATIFKKTLKQDYKFLANTGLTKLNRSLKVKFLLSLKLKKLLPRVTGVVKINKVKPFSVMTLKKAFVWRKLLKLRKFVKLTHSSKRINKSVKSFSPQWTYKKTSPKLITPNTKSLFNILKNRLFFWRCAKSSSSFIKTRLIRLQRLKIQGINSLHNNKITADLMNKHGKSLKTPQLRVITLMRWKMYTKLRRALFNLLVRHYKTLTLSIVSQQRSMSREELLRRLNNFWKSSKTSLFTFILPKVMYCIHDSDSVFLANQVANHTITHSHIVFHALSQTTNPTRQIKCKTIFTLDHTTNYIIRGITNNQKDFVTILGRNIKVSSKKAQIGLIQKINWTKYTKSGKFCRFNLKSIRKTNFFFKKFFNSSRCHKFVRLTHYNKKYNNFRSNIILFRVLKNIKIVAAQSSVNNSVHLPPLTPQPTYSLVNTRKVPINLIKCIVNHLTTPNHKATTNNGKNASNNYKNKIKIRQQHSDTTLKTGRSKTQGEDFGKNRRYNSTKRQKQSWVEKLKRSTIKVISQKKDTSYITKRLVKPFLRFQTIMSKEDNSDGKPCKRATARTLAYKAVNIIVKRNKLVKDVEEFHTSRPHNKLFMASLAISGTKDHNPRQDSEIGLLSLKQLRFKETFNYESVKNKTHDFSAMHLRHHYDADPANLEVGKSDFSTVLAADKFGSLNHLKKPLSNRLRLNSLKKSRRLMRTRSTLIIPARVHIRLITSSYDVIHSWFIPGLGLKFDCIPGRSTHHTLYVQTPGLYFGQCAEICGRFHHHMPIRIYAVSFTHFASWWMTRFSRFNKKPDNNHYA